MLLGQQGLLANGTAPVVDGVYAEPSGVRVTAYNNDVASQDLYVQVLCGKFNAEFGGALAVGVVNVPTRQFGRGEARCPPGFYATGGGYLGLGVATIDHHYDWQIGARLSVRSDGVHDDPPNAWAANVANPSTTDQPFLTNAYCRKVPLSSLRTHVVSLSLAPGERRFLGVNPPDKDYVLGGGGNGGTEGRVVSDAVWRSVTRSAAQAVLQRGFNFTSLSDEFVPAPGGIFGGFFLDVRPTLAAKAASPVNDVRFTLAAKAASPVKVAVVVAPTQESPRPVSIVRAIEYYNTAWNHYFLTSLPPEIGDLDNKVHPGWERTGESFNVYAAGSGGPLGRLPVCRYYGLASAGLDSHFYTASVLECLDVGAQFAGAWQIESGEVFQIHLPNIVTGDCPMGTVAVLRTWNKRADSNHRYVVHPALRDLMLQQGHIAEGYGPNGVAFCAPA